MWTNFLQPAIKSNYVKCFLHFCRCVVPGRERFGKNDTAVKNEPFRVSVGFEDEHVLYNLIIDTDSIGCEANESFCSQALCRFYFFENS